MATAPEALEDEIRKLKARNARVEAEKAWETSVFRRALIAGGTYIVSTVFLYSINVPTPCLSSPVPTFGYLLSTMTLPFIRDWWVSNRKGQGASPHLVF